MNETHHSFFTLRFILRVWKRDKSMSSMHSPQLSVKALVLLVSIVSLVTRLVQWGIPRCEMGQTTMQSLEDLSLNLAGSIKLPYMGNLKKEKSHVIAK